MKYLSGRDARISSFPFFYPQTQERESNSNFASCTPPVCCAYFDSMGGGRICKFRVLDAYEQTKRTKPWRPCFLLEEETLSSDQFKFCLPHGISFQKFALSDWQHLKSILWQNWFSISSGGRWSFARTPLIYPIHFPQELSSSTGHSTTTEELFATHRLPLFNSLYLPLLLPSPVSSHCTVLRHCISTLTSFLKLHLWCPLPLPW